MRQPVQVAVYCVRECLPGWEFLLLRRIPSNGAFWQGITGGVEGKEDYYTAALRELQEETGYIPIWIEIIDFSYTFPVERQMQKLYKCPVDMITEIVFLARVNGTIKPRLDPKEHDSWTWCSYEKALEMVYWAGNKESLKYCELHLQSRNKTDI